MSSLVEIEKRLENLADGEAAKVLQRFFKTGPGEYGEGDVFIGIKVPPLRKLAADSDAASFRTVRSLLKSRIHEKRVLAVMILVRWFARADEELRKRIYEFYVANLSSINNWDLVDGSAPYIVGPYLLERDRSQLYVFAASSSVWERRIAILSTFYFIRQND